MVLNQISTHAHYDIDSEVLAWIDRTTRQKDFIRPQQVVELTTKEVLSFVIGCILVEVIFIAFVVGILGFTVTGKKILEDFSWVVALVLVIFLVLVKCLSLLVQKWDGVGIMLCLKLLEVILNITVFSYAVIHISWVWYLYWAFLFTL